MATLIDTDYPVYSVLALQEKGTVLLAGGGGASHTGVPNALEVYRVELISRKPSTSLLCRHDLGPELVRQLSPSPRDSHTLLASVDDGCRLVKVISEGEGEEEEREEEEEDEEEVQREKEEEEEEEEAEEEEEEGEEEGEEEEEDEEEVQGEEKEKEEEEGEAGGSKGDDESDGDHGSVMKVEEIGQKPEMGDFPVENSAGPKEKGNTPTEKEDSVRRDYKAKTARQETSAQGGGDDKEEGGTRVKEEKSSILRQRKKADKTDVRVEQVKTSKSPMKEERFAFEIGEKHQSDFAGGEDALQKVAKFSCDGKLVVTGGVDGCVRVWKYPSFEKVFELQGHSDEIYDVDVHPKEQVAVSVSSDQGGIVWDLEKGKEIERFDCQSSKGTEYWSRCCQFSPLVGSEEGGVVLHTLAIPVKWNKRTAPDSYLVRRNTEDWLVDLTRSVAKDRATAMCVSNDGRLLAVGTAGGNIHIYNHKYQPITMATKVHTFSVTGLAFCRLVDPAIKGAGLKDRGKMAALSVSADRTCCATMVTERKGASRTIFFFLIATVLLLLAIYVQFLLM